MNIQRIRLIIISVIIIATLVFIFSNSLESMEESGTKSSRVMKVIEPILDTLVGKGNVTDHLVRKLAHFVEFFTLGIELAMLFIICRRFNVQGVINCLFISLAFAVTDEALQLISERGSQVQDVLLDFVSTTAGIAIIVLGNLLISAISRRKSTENVNS